jgi:hypothetical protein
VGVTLLSGAEGEWLKDTSGHGLDEWDRVGHHIVPLWVGPGGLATQLPVSHALVAPAATNFNTDPQINVLGPTNK